MEAGSGETGGRRRPNLIEVARSGLTSVLLVRDYEDEEAAELGEPCSWSDGARDASQPCPSARTAPHGASSIELRVLPPAAINRCLTAECRPRRVFAEATQCGRKRQNLLTLHALLV